MADARVEQARALAAAGQFKEAVGVLKALLQANGQDGEARQLLAEVQDSMMLDIQIGDRLERAQALAEQGQKEQALKLLGDVMKVAPNHPRAASLAASLTAPASPAPGALPDLNPNATVSMDAFELEDLPIGSGPSSPAGPASSPLSGAAPEFSLEPLDSLEPSQGSPVEATFTTPSTNLGPAEAARVQQYVSEGQALFDQGRYQDAIDLWTRIFIVDENNKDADALIAKAKEAMNANQGEIEHNLTEGIAAFNAGDYGRSRPLLEKVLAAFPGHREAQYYLQRMGEAVPMSHQAWTDAPAAPRTASGLRCPAARLSPRRRRPSPLHLPSRVPPRRGHPRDRPSPAAVRTSSSSRITWSSRRGRPCVHRLRRRLTGDSSSRAAPRWRPAPASQPSSLRRSLPPSRQTPSPGTITPRSPRHRSMWLRPPEWPVGMRFWESPGRCRGLAPRRGSRPRHPRPAEVPRGSSSERRCSACCSWASVSFSPAASFSAATVSSRPRSSRASSPSPKPPRIAPKPVVTCGPRGADAAEHEPR